MAAASFDTRALEDSNAGRPKPSPPWAAGADRDPLATRADLYAITADLRELRAEFRTATAFVAALLIALSGRSFGVF